jgi:hypothetical protein
MSMDKLAKFADFDIEKMYSAIYGYDVKKVKTFRDKLRNLCADADLIWIAKKRWAGEEHTEMHEDSDTLVDRLIQIIISEMIKVEKQNNLKLRKRESK